MVKNTSYYEWWGSKDISEWLFQLFGSSAILRKPLNMVSNYFWGVCCQFAGFLASWYFLREHGWLPKCETAIPTLIRVLFPRQLTKSFIGNLGLMRSCNVTLPSFYFIKRAWIKLVSNNFLVQILSFLKKENYAVRKNIVFYLRTIFGKIRWFNS